MDLALKDLELTLRDEHFSKEWYLTRGYPYARWCWGDPNKWVNGKLKEHPRLEVLALAIVAPSSDGRDEA